MSIPSSTTHWVWELEVLDLTGAELTEAIQRFGRVRKEIQAGRLVAPYGDRAVVDTIVNPVPAKLKLVGQSYGGIWVMRCSGGAV